MANLKNAKFNTPSKKKTKKKTLNQNGKLLKKYNVCE